MKYLFLILVVVLSACSFVVEVDDTPHSIRVYVPTQIVENTLTPTNTATPQATTTPLYGTEVPTYTPSPVPSVVPSFTPVIPPTQEVVTPTPGPSSTPVNAYSCLVGVATYALNVRAEPSTTAVRVGQVYNADQYEVYAIKFESVYHSETKKLIGHNEWAQIEYEPGKLGWIAVEYWYNNTQYFYAAYPDLELCNDIRFPPPNIAGIHTLFDTTPHNAAVLFSDIGTFKTTSGGESLGALYKAFNPSGVWFHRGLFHDEPAIYEWYQPELFVNRIQDEWNTGADYYEVINEVGAPSWKIFADFTIKVLEIANQKGICIAWGSFPAGNPDYPAWQELVRVIEWADTHPCRPGEYHAIAIHQPLYVPADIPRQSGNWMDESHIVDRLSYVDTLVKTYTGKGLAEHPGGNVYITEIGLDDGYSGNWLDSWTCEDIARSFWFSVSEITKRYPYVKGIHLWTFGDGNSIWTDRQDCAETIVALK